MYSSDLTFVSKLICGGVAKNFNAILAAIAVIFIADVKGIAIADDGTPDKRLLAIFAHPDDESTVAPILARYSREGVVVHVIIATDGRYGTNDHSGLKAGDGLVKIRRSEMRCSAAALGVELTHLDYHDQLRAAEGYDGHIPHVRGLILDVADVISQVQPDVIITWGPDGGSNHMDHRLVGDTVTGVFLSRDWDKPMSLFYYGTPASQIDDENVRALYGVADEYMTTVVSYLPEDIEAAEKSMRCHTSQFTEADVERMISGKQRLGSKIYLRRFEPPRSNSDSVF